MVGKALSEADFDALGKKNRRYFTQKNRLPLKDFNKERYERLLLKRIGYAYPFWAIKMDIPFCVENDEGSKLFFRSGSWLLYATNTDDVHNQDLGRLFGLTEDEFDKRYIEY